MIKINCADAKTHFLELIRRVRAGQEFRITHRGQVVAVLTSPEFVERQHARRAYQQLLELRKQHPIGSVDEVTAWKQNSGRC